MQSKTNPLVSGAAFLAATGILVKILGLVFKIPLVYIIGEDGMGYFNSAYTIYNLFFILGNSGLPVAISILVCREMQKTDNKQPGRLFSTLFSAIFAVGVIGFAILLLGAKTLARFIGNPKADICIAVMAPVFFFVCLAGALRGYFQGMSRMMPTGVSQLIEALCKTTLGVALGLYAMQKGYALPVQAAFSLFGIAIGSFLSLLYLFLLAFFKKEETAEKGKTKGCFSMIGRMFSIALPVTLGSLVLSLSNFIDLGAIMRGLVKMGLTAKEANRMYGNYTALAVPMFNLPPVLILPVSQAVVPAMTAAKAKMDTEKMGKISFVALKSASIITLPCMLVFALYARPVLSLLFEDKAADRAAPALTMLAPALFFVGIVTVTNSLLQSVGKTYLPVFSMLLGGAVKLTVSMLLIPRIGILGAPIGTLLCYFVIALGGLLSARRYAGLSIRIKELLWTPLFCAFIACLAGYPITYIKSGRLSTLLSLATVGIAYVLLLIVCGVLKKEELLSLPIPKKIKKFIIKKEPKHEKRQGTCST